VPRSLTRVLATLLAAATVWMAAVAATIWLVR